MDDDERFTVVQQDGITKEARAVDIVNILGRGLT